MNSEDAEKEKLDKGLPDGVSSEQKGSEATFAASAMPESTQVSLSSSPKSTEQNPSSHDTPSSSVSPAVSPIHSDPSKNSPAQPFFPDHPIS